MAILFINIGKKKSKFQNLLNLSRKSVEDFGQHQDI
jgi:hypothetical protein